MRKVTAFATLFFILLIGWPALATSLDGNQLLLDCTAEVRVMETPEEQGAPWKDLADGKYCMGLVRGVDMSSQDIATPQGVTLGQEIRVVLLYLQTHPEELNTPDFVLVHKSLQKAFPAKP